MVVAGKILAIVSAMIAALLIPFIVQFWINKKNKQYDKKTFFVFCTLFITMIVIAVVGIIITVVA